MIKQYTIVANFKMNMNHIEVVSYTQKLAIKLAQRNNKNIELVLIPSFTNLRSLQVLSNCEKLYITYGAQNISPYSNGAYTGAISGKMLSALGCSYVIIGHSETRILEANYGYKELESKIDQSYASNLIPIICFGDNKEMRENNKYILHLSEELKILNNILQKYPDNKYILAYEPLWAINTGVVATNKEIEEVSLLVNKLIRDPYLIYGGSVNEYNINDIKNIKGVSGVLVGKSSLDVDKLYKIACNYMDLV